MAERKHPLSLGDQVTPIIDLMAISNAHFAKLRDTSPCAFRLASQSRLVRGWLGQQEGPRAAPPAPAPAGEWQQGWLRAGLLTEIPLFRVLSAASPSATCVAAIGPGLGGCRRPRSAAAFRYAEGGPGAVRFAALCVPREGAEHDPSAAPREPLPCEVDPAVFEVPEGTACWVRAQRGRLRDEDDDLLQFAIQQASWRRARRAEQVGCGPGWALGVGPGWQR